MSKKDRSIDPIDTTENGFYQEVPETDSITPVEETPVEEEKKEEKKEEVKKEEPKEVTPTISTPTPVKNEEPKKEEAAQPSIIGTVFTKGKLVKLKNVPVYDGPMTLYPSKYLTGNYFIYDGIERAKRYRICAGRGECGRGTKYIVGYIEKKYMK